MKFLLAFLLTVGSTAPNVSFSVRENLSPNHFLVMPIYPARVVLYQTAGKVPQKFDTLTCKVEQVKKPIKANGQDATISILHLKCKDAEFDIEGLEF